MKKGGARKGAGRPKGSPSKATIARQERIASTGVVPLDVIIEDMRFHYSAYQEALARSENHVAAQELALARNAAKDAAPYVHPKLAAIEHMGKGGGPIEYTDARDKLSHLIARASDAIDESEDTVTSH